MSLPPAERRYGTISEAAQRFGLGVKLLRRKANAGAFPLYDAGTSRMRVCFAEVEAWLRSTSRPISQRSRCAMGRLPDERSRRERK